MEETINKLKEFYKILHDKIVNGELKLKFRPADSIGYVASVDVQLGNYKFSFSISEKDFICTFGFQSSGDSNPDYLFSKLFSAEEIDSLRRRAKESCYRLKEQEIKLLKKRLKELENGENV